METAIHTRALLAGLTIRSWTARKLDKAVTNKVHADYQASGNSGRYNKNLLPGDCPEYRALMSHVSAVRNGFYARTLPWGDAGDRLLPTDNFMTVSDWYRDAARTFGTLLDAFIAVYPAARLAAQQLMPNGLFKVEDYPSDAEVRARFECAIEYWPVPAQGDIRCDLAADQIATIEAGIGDRLTKATETAMSDAWKRLHTVVAAMAERLDSPDKVFRDSLVENTREVVDMLKRLNVTGDPDLERMRATVEDQLARHEPDTLRESDATRATVAAQADAILSQMKGIYGR